MNLQAVKANNRRRAFEVATSRGDFLFPYAVCDTPPSSADPIVKVFIDDELGGDAFTFVLASGAEDSVHVDFVFDYNEEPVYVRDMLLHKLTCAALDALARSPLSKREIIRRLGTSPAQFYRLLDTTNYTKSIDKMLALLQVLDCEVDLVVRAKACSGRRS